MVLHKVPPSESERRFLRFPGICNPLVLERLSCSQSLLSLSRQQLCYQVLGTAVSDPLIHNHCFITI